MSEHMPNPPVDPFDNPGTGARVVWEDMNGSLLMLEVVEHVKDVKTAYGENDAIRATIHVLDGDGKGDTYEDALVFPKFLQGQLRSKIGKKVLGRLGQGTAKQGQDPPWTLADPTEDDRKVGLAYWEQLNGAPPF